jgi:nucleoside-diphosphate-sugar epimerase
MKIVVIGSTGLIGSRLVTNLRAHGHEAVAASPQSGVNSVTGNGLADGLQGSVEHVCRLCRGGQNAEQFFGAAAREHELGPEVSAYLGEWCTLPERVGVIRHP